MNRLVCAMWLAVASVLAYSAQASEETVGPMGINSIATGLNGMGVPIGQVEANRAGKHGYDTAANCCNAEVVPDGVFFQDMGAAPNQAISDHALWVASVMISNQTNVQSPDQSPPIGVAPQANLLSSAFGVAGNLQEDAAITAQVLAGSVWATNMSFSVPDEGFPLDGTSTLTLFVDWSARWHEVLYIVAGNEITKPDAVPTDNFNGITVAASRKAADGVFREISGINVYDESMDAVGVRTSTDILAPGERLHVAGANGTIPSTFAGTGTSFAAPHVTGTLALLQQQATSTNGRRHLTMKAVILNSADKIKGIIEMERTVGDDAWFESDAYTDPNIPLDREMGVGHLNANRAVRQHAAGERPQGAVPDIGWDYAIHNDPFAPFGYTLSLDAGDWVSATLVWDREVFPNSPFLEYQRGDGFIDLGFANFDLYLVPLGQGIEQAVASSTSTAWNVEHIFASVPEAGNYELQVWKPEAGDIPFALAWWAGSDERTAPGDFNGDGDVNAADYVAWRKNNGTPTEYEEWRANFGNTSGSGSVLDSSVPEPTGFLLLVTVMPAILLTGRCRNGLQIG